MTARRRGSTRHLRRALPAAVAALLAGVLSGCVTRGEDVPRPNVLVDVAPTILGLAGVAAPPGFGSALTRDELRPRDLTPWLTGNDAGEFPELLARSSPNMFGRRQTSLRTPTHKLIEIEGKERRAELFDLRADPGEQRNLAGSAQGQALAARLGAEIREFARAVAGRSLASQADIDEDQRERLRALGYLH